jgi:hypothetical protein
MRNTTHDVFFQPKRGKYEGLSRQQTRRKIAREMDDQDGAAGVRNGAIRAVKKAGRPTKITEAAPKKHDPRAKRRKGDSSMKAKALGKGGFDDDMNKRGKAAREGMRAGRSDGVGLGKKKGGSGSKGKTGGKGKGRK